MSGCGGAILVTGATGALGRPLIAALLDNGVERVYAMTHTGSLAPGDSRVQVVTGDIRTGVTLGLTADRLDEIRDVISGIVHAAADTRFDAALDAARRTNTGGVRNVLGFAAGCRRLDRMLVLSTTHVAGRRTGPILEDELEHDAGFVNSYEQSKFEAEREVRGAFGRLPISVCRLSTVVGDSRTGDIARYGAMHRAVRLMYASLAPMVPGTEDSPVDIIALDYAAAAIAWLATAGFSPGHTWHLSAAGDTIPAGELLDLTIDCFHAYRPAWRTRAIARPALVDLQTFELFHRSVEQLGDASLRASTAVVAYFAPQLAFPKRFDTRRCMDALTASTIVKPSSRDTWRRVVRRLIEPPEIDALSAAEDAGRG